MAPRHQVVIVGAGFGGLSAAKAFKDSSLDITLIDRSNHYVFSPLLYQVATAGLSPGDIAEPIRNFFRRQRNVIVLMDEVVSVNLQNASVGLAHHSAIHFDDLVLATGSAYSYFGRDEWREWAPSLKTVSDATHIRARVLLAFERAEMEDDDEKRKRSLTFVIVGGGPTGVELAGAIAELAHRALAEDFRRINPRSARIVLIEGGPRLLATFPEDLSERAKKDLEKLGVEVLLGDRVESISDRGAEVRGKWIEANTVLWAAGVVANPVGQWLGAKTDPMGRVKVLPTLTIPDHPNVYVIGDGALVLDQEGNPLPGVAPVAMQQGRYVAKAIVQKIHQEDPPPFHYFNKGNLATIGRSKAVADFGWIQLSGWTAWLVWSVVHIYYLIGLERRLLVFIQWAWAYVTFKRGARLITMEESSQKSISTRIH